MRNTVSLDDTHDPRWLDDTIKALAKVVSCVLCHTPSSFVRRGGRTIATDSTIQACTSARRNRQENRTPGEVLQPALAPHLRTRNLEPPSQDLLTPPDPSSPRPR